MKRVVDGNTIVVRVAQTVAGETLPANATSKVRLLHVDAPRKTTCAGKKSITSLSKAIPAGSRIYLEADTDDTDRQGRYLRSVWLDDGRLLNRLIVRRGYGEANRSKPNDLHWNRIHAAQRDARDKNAGIWGDLCAPEPPPGPEPDPPPAPKPDADPEPEPQPDPKPEPEPGCHPSYEPCVPIARDVDCLGGSGDGPEYTGPVRVLGPDDYGLDADNDGLGCED